MKTEIDVCGNRDQIDIFQDGILKGQIEEDGNKGGRWWCHNFMKTPVETKEFYDFKDALLLLEEVL